MDDMGIAALSVGQSLARVSEDLGIAALKMAMDTTSQEVLGELAAAMPQGDLDPALGTKLDIYA